MHHEQIKEYEETINKRDTDLRVARNLLTAIGPGGHAVEEGRGRPHTLSRVSAYLRGSGSRGGSRGSVGSPYVAPSTQAAEPVDTRGGAPGWGGRLRRTANNINNGIIKQPGAAFGRLQRKAMSNMASIPIIVGRKSKSETPETPETADTVETPVVPVV